LAAARVRVLVAARLGLSGGYFRVRRYYIVDGVFLSGLSFSPFMVLSAHRTFKLCSYYKS
jgi:hypothetical protein